MVKRVVDNLDYPAPCSKYHRETLTRPSFDYRTPDLGVPDRLSFLFSNLNSVVKNSLELVTGLKKGVFSSLFVTHSTFRSVETFSSNCEKVLEIHLSYTLGRLLSIHGLTNDDPLKKRVSRLCTQRLVEVLLVHSGRGSTWADSRCPRGRSVSGQGCSGLSSSASGVVTFVRERRVGSLLVLSVPTVVGG